jgi:phenylacetate-CoA ligase
MNDLLLSAYHASPPWLRNVFASVEGYRLRRERYDEGTEDLIAEALERERWSAEKWRTWQEDRLARVLHHSARHVPFYREHWLARRRAGDCSSSEDLSNWPILEKDSIRRQPKAFLADSCITKRLYTDVTSGTTGQPVRFWFGEEQQKTWWALGELRWRRWNGLSRHDRWALFGTRLVAPFKQQTPPFWVWNSGLNQLYSSVYHLSERSAPYYLEALHRHRITYLWGHSAALYSLARAAIQSPRPCVRLRLALSSSEPLFQYQRRAVLEAFGCPMKETYGMAEMAAGASECAFGTLHTWPELAWLEVLPLEQPGSTTGHLLSTTLLNPSMPLIRYRTGDLVAARSPATPCPCGRSLPAIAGIEGRSSDMLYSADGRQISPSAAEMIFDTDLDIAEGQLIQETLRRLRIRFVPGGKQSDTVETLLRRRVRERFGDMELLLDPVSQIPREANGKFRAAVCQIPKERRPSQMSTAHSRD